MNMITRLQEQGRIPAPWLKSYCHDISQKSIPYSLIPSGIVRDTKAYAATVSTAECPSNAALGTQYHCCFTKNMQRSCPSLVSHCHISLPRVNLICIIWKGFIIFPKNYVLVLCPYPFQKMFMYAVLVYSIQNNDNYNLH